jgi:hypothetical protein
MKLTSRADVSEMMSAYLASAALNAALELGLFWQLAEQPQTAASISQTMGIPHARCQYWLDLLAQLGLLDQAAGIYSVSHVARSSILDIYSQATWSFLARRMRERYPSGVDLALHIQYPGSVWSAQDLTPPHDYQIVKENPEWANRFTRMIYEVHQPLSIELAEKMDMTGVQRMMDLGGGSGVMSFALLRRNPQLTSVVVDVENVCVTGRKIASAVDVSDRITYYSADFVCDELPSGFDLALECDVGIYSVELFRKVHAALNANGRLIIVSRWAQEDGMVLPPLLPATFRSTLDNPDFVSSTIAKTQAMITSAGFENKPEWSLSSGDVVIEARK